LTHDPLTPTIHATRRTRARFEVTPMELRRIVLVSCCLPALLLGCDKNRKEDAVVTAAATPAGPTSAVATVEPTVGNTVKGVVRFDEVDGKLKVTADFEGLAAGEMHAFHVHEKGDCSSGDGKSAGDHYNPEGHQHGLPETAMRHAGDLGNVQADAQGKAHYEIVVENASVSGKNPIFGRAVIVHAKKDDGGQPTGNAGGRVACGVIKAP
jgi:Cu-Zn family superoxide dismutase